MYNTCSPFSHSAGLFSTNQPHFLHLSGFKEQDLHGFLWCIKLVFASRLKGQCGQHEWGEDEVKLSTIFSLPACSVFLYQISELIWKCGHIIWASTVLIPFFFFWIIYRAFLVTENKSVKSKLLRKTPAHRPLPSNFQVRLKSNTQPDVPHPRHRTHTNLPKNHRLPQRYYFPSEFTLSQETCATPQGKSWDRQCKMPGCWSLEGADNPLSCSFPRISFYFLTTQNTVFIHPNMGNSSSNVWMK